jgi:hypothetical protein
MGNRNPETGNDFGRTVANPEEQAAAIRKNGSDIR